MKRIATVLVCLILLFGAGAAMVSWRYSKSHVVVVNETSSPIKGGTLWIATVPYPLGSLKPGEGRRFNFKWGVGSKDPTYGVKAEFSNGRSLEQRAGYFSLPEIKVYSDTILVRNAQICVRQGKSTRVDC